MSDEVLCAIEGGVATITLNRPGQRNAMNAALLAALRQRFEELDANRDVRVVVVRGAGPAFCSGTRPGRGAVTRRKTRRARTGVGRQSRRGIRPCGGATSRPQA